MIHDFRWIAESFIFETLSRSIIKDLVNILVNILFVPGHIIIWEKA